MLVLLVKSEEKRRRVKITLEQGELEQSLIRPCPLRGLMWKAEHLGPCGVL